MLFQLQCDRGAEIPEAPAALIHLRRARLSQDFGVEFSQPTTSVIQFQCHSAVTSLGSMPATFSRKVYPSKARSGTIAARYRANLNKHPFVLFGLPFLATIVAGSFFLTPATALRYEKHDRKVRQVSKDEELGIGQNRRKVDMKDEYYRLAAKDLDNWENRRVERLKGEPDGVL